MYPQVMTFSDGNILLGETVETSVTAIMEQLKKLPPENQTEEVIAYILDVCLHRVKGKRLIL